MLNKKTNSLSIILLGLVLALAGLAQTALKPGVGPTLYLDLQNGMTADGAVALALENNGEIQALRKEVEASRANLSEAQNGPRAPEIKRAQAELNDATAVVTRTTKDLERARTLAAKGTIPLQQRDAAEAAAKQAIARRDAARQSLALLVQGTRPERIAAARAQVAGAQAGLTGAAASVADLTLTAPIAGVVLSRNAEPGEILAVGQSAVTLGEVRRPWVRVYVNSRDIPTISVNSPARGALDGMPNRIFNGHVVAINTKAFFLNDAATTEKVK